MSNVDGMVPTSPRLPLAAPSDDPGAAADDEDTDDGVPAGAVVAVHPVVDVRSRHPARVKTRGTTRTAPLWCAAPASTPIVQFTMRA
jgi:hypothetical protein